MIKEVRPAINGLSPTQSLKEHGIDLRASELYKEMHKEGLVDYHEVKRYLGGINLKWEITDKGRYFGYNQHSSSLKKYPVQVKLYQDRFPELLELVNYTNP